MSSPERLLSITSRIAIPLSELEFSFARSGGPGGQNVNKVSSKATMRWNPAASASIPPQVMARFMSTYGNRLTTEGELVITSQTYRDQGRNVDECLEKLREMVASVVTPPKVRRPTKPSRAARAKRVDGKRVDGKKKQQRRRPGMDD